MPEKEATARIKINKLLEAAGWRFFQEGNAPANIRLEPSVTIKSTDLDALGDNFEKTTKGFVDFLLLDAKGFPLMVLEAKAEAKNPLIAKEQARKYAKSQNCRFVMLSNGNLHYFWDLERGNPYVITSFPTPDSVTGYQKVTPNPERLIAELLGDDYIVLTQRPNYRSEAGWRNEAERPGYNPGQQTSLSPALTLAGKKRFYDWVFNGEKLYQQLRSHYPLFDGEQRKGRVCFETFPHAVVCALAGRVIRARPKASIRRNALRNRGYDCGPLPNIDFVDAALCAVAAEAFRHGRIKRFGGRSEGFIVVPALDVND